MNLTMKNEWEIEETTLIHDALKEHESIFALSNGYVGIRGFHSEFCELAQDDSTYLNGFYDQEAYIYGESAFGYAKAKQKMIPLPQLAYMKLFVDGEPVQSTSKVEGYRRTLHMEKGMLEKDYTFVSTSGKTLQVHCETIVSHDLKHTIAWSYQITCDQPCQIEFCSYAHKTLENDGVEVDDPRVGSLRKQQYLHLLEEVSDQDNGFYKYQTDESGLTLLAWLTHRFWKQPIETCFVQQANVDQTIVQFALEAEETIAFTKYVSFYDEAIDFTQFQEQCFAKKLDFVAIKERQEQIFKSFWQEMDIALESDETIVSALRFNIFSLFQHVGKDGKKNICAKGLSGEGYEGHYFWDTEIYILPFFVYNMPEIARNLLVTRYRMLEKAKARAKLLSYEGCLYAWRTINGEEASAYYPAGTAQIHMNADIAYAIAMYYNATQDRAFMETMGLEMLREIATFFVSYVDYIEGKGFVINGVTGPDEYSALVNNNIYTNLMVKQLFQTILTLQETFTLTDFGFSKAMLADYEMMQKALYIHQENGLYAQDETFFTKAPWDFEKRNKHPLLLHYHPMVIYKHQVLKQADIVLSLLTNFTFYTYADTKAIYEYYEPLTTHDSTLSETVHGIIASRINHSDEAFAYFANTVKTDLFNEHHNVDAGLHMAAMAGGWQSLFYGFAGIRIDRDTVYISPNLPEQIRQLKLSFYFRKVKITLHINHDRVRIDCDKQPSDAGFQIQTLALGEDYK